MNNLQNLLRIAIIQLGLSISFFIVAMSPSSAFEWEVAKFNQATHLAASPELIRQNWQALQFMSTTDYLGSQIDDIILTQSAMVAGAIAFGSIEFDNLVRTGQVPEAFRGSVEPLLEVMRAATAIDLTSIIHANSQYQRQEFAPAPVFAQTAPISNQGTTTTGNSCSPYVQTALQEQGQQYVTEITNASTSNMTGFSTIKTKEGDSITGGFANLGCLEQLFLNFNITALFSPPNFSTLTSSLQDWNCEAALDVVSQFTDGQSDRILNQFLTPFNLKTANDSSGQPINQTSTFHFLTNEQQELSSNASLTSLFE